MGKGYPKSGTGKKRTVGVMAALTACFVLLVALIGGAIGKYRQNYTSDSVVKAMDFYFTSDILDGTTHVLDAGSTEVTFTLGNHADELRYSEVDIDYKVTVTKDDGTATDPAVTVTPETGKLEKGKGNDAEVTISGLTPGIYNITATGTKGYVATLTGKIEVRSTEPAVYKHLEVTGDYVVLTVWAQNYKGPVTITPPAGLIPDNTDPVMQSVQTGAAFTDSTSFKDTDANPDGYASHTYRFFGNTAVNAENFTVSYDNGNKTADVKAPTD